MRVGLLIYGRLDTISGGYLYDRMLVEYLQQAGDKVVLVSLPWRTYASHLGDNLSPALARKLENLPVDVLLQDELNHPSLFCLNAWLKKRLRYPLVTIVHHLRCSELRPAWQNRLYAWVERRYLEGLDGFIYNSQTTRNVVSQIAPGAADRPGVVAYPAGDRFNSPGSDAFAAGIDVETIKRRAYDPGPLRLVFLGNLIPRKGLHLLIDALHILHSQKPVLQPVPNLEIIGGIDIDPVYVHMMQQRVQEYGLQAQIKFLGYLDHEALAARLRFAQVLALPSSYEGFGIAYLEGMSFGLPALATQSGAAGEIITHAQDGYLIPSESPQPLADCLALLAQDRQTLARLSLAARQRFLKHPGWQQTGKVIRQFLLQEIVK